MDELSIELYSLHVKIWCREYKKQQQYKQYQIKY